MTPVEMVKVAQDKLTELPKKKETSAVNSSLQAIAFVGAAVAIGIFGHRLIHEINESVAIAEHSIKKPLQANELRKRFLDEIDNVRSLIKNTISPKVEKMTEKEVEFWEQYTKNVGGETAVQRRDTLSLAQKITTTLADRIRYLVSPVDRIRHLGSPDVIEHGEKIKSLADSIEKDAWILYNKIYTTDSKSFLLDATNELKKMMNDADNQLKAFSERIAKEGVSVDSVPKQVISNLPNTLKQAWLKSKNGIIGSFLLSSFVAGMTIGMNAAKEFSSKLDDAISEGIDNILEKADEQKPVN